MTTDVKNRILKDSRDRACILTINLPERRNALDAETRTELMAALTSAYAAPSVEVIILQGTPKVFSAGGDVTTMLGLTEEQASQRIQLAHQLPRMIHTGPKPVIAVVEGVCAGAGLGLASVCDLIVAGAEARFVTAFEKVGFMPDFGVTWALTQRMGAQAAKRFFLLGGVLKGPEAESKGLADFCVPAGQALDRALELAAQLAANAPATRRSVRDVFRDMPLGFEEVLALEAERQAKLYRSEDAAEGIAAFMEKRSPVWRDR